MWMRKSRWLQAWHNKHQDATEADCHHTDANCNIKAPTNTHNTHTHTPKHHTQTQTHNHRDTLTQPDTHTHPQPLTLTHAAKLKYNERLSRQERAPQLLLTLSCWGVVHQLSGLDTALSLSTLKIMGGCRCTYPSIHFLCACTLKIRKLTHMLDSSQEHTGTDRHRHRHSHTGTQTTQQIQKFKCCEATRLGPKTIKTKNKSWNKIMKNLFFDCSFFLRVSFLMRFLNV